MRLTVKVGICKQLWQRRIIMRMSKKYQTLSIKFPKSILKKIEVFAKNNGRLLQDEVIARLVVNIIDTERFKEQDEYSYLFSISLPKFKK